MPRITKGISLLLNNKVLANLQSTPNFGKGEKSSVEKTTLSDDARTYMAGLREPSDKLTFGFLYDAGEENSSYDALKNLESGDFKLSYPDGTAFVFSADVDVVIGSAEAGDPLTFSLNLIPTSEIKDADEAQAANYEPDENGDEE